MVAVLATVTAPVAVAWLPLISSVPAETAVVPV